MCFDDKKVTMATFMYVSRGFDCMDLDILLIQLKRYGVDLTSLHIKQGTLYLLESGPISITKFYYWCYAGINSW